ncbi:MAG: HAD-IC family P-type ATPase, partial [Bacteroidota bacterium]
PAQKLELVKLYQEKGLTCAMTGDGITECKAGGIKVAMLTGDHLATARNIAFRAGLTAHENELAISGKELEQFNWHDEQQIETLLQTKVFARVTPAQKLELVKLYQEKGLTCAMTGDGINDTPALKKADIGIAMGQRGTEAAREVADLVLKNDAFSSIVLAVRQGRGIFENIRLFVIYLMSCNLSELLVVGVAFLANLTMPLMALQILFINMVTDVFPALALGMNREAPDVMQRPPRNRQSNILLRRHWQAIVVYALALTGATIGALLFATYQLKADAATINNISFYTLILAQLWHVFNLTGANVSFWNNEVINNKHVWGAIATCLLITIMIYQVPVLREVLHLVPLELIEILYIILFSLIPIFLIQTLKRLGWIA